MSDLHRYVFRPPQYQYNGGSTRETKRARGVGEFLREYKATPCTQHDRFDVGDWAIQAQYHNGYTARWNGFESTLCVNGVELISPPQSWTNRLPRGCVIDGVLLYRDRRSPEFGGVNLANRSKLERYNIAAWKNITLYASDVRDTRNTQPGGHVSLLSFAARQEVLGDLIGNASNIEQIASYRLKSPQLTDCVLAPFVSRGAVGVTLTNLRDPDSVRSYAFQHGRQAATRMMSGADAKNDIDQGDEEYADRTIPPDVEVAPNAEQERQVALRHVFERNEEIRLSKTPSVFGPPAAQPAPPSAPKNKANWVKGATAVGLLAMKGAAVAVLSTTSYGAYCDHISRALNTANACLTKIKDGLIASDNKKAYELAANAAAERTRAEAAHTTKFDSDVVQIKAAQKAALDETKHKSKVKCLVAEANRITQYNKDEAKRQSDCTDQAAARLRLGDSEAELLQLQEYADESRSIAGKRKDAHRLNEQAIADETIYLDFNATVGVERIRVQQLPCSLTSLINDTSIIQRCIDSISIASKQTIAENVATNLAYKVANGTLATIMLQSLTTVTPYLNHTIEAMPEYTDCITRNTEAIDQHFKLVAIGAFIALTASALLIKNICKSQPKLAGARALVVASNIASAGDLKSKDGFDRYDIDELEELKSQLIVMMNGFCALHNEIV